MAEEFINSVKISKSEPTNWIFMVICVVSEMKLTYERKISKCQKFILLRELAIFKEIISI